MSKIWRKGQLHTHTYWSDGIGFPEEMASLYKESGYDFVFVTDHNVLGDDPNMWLQLQASEEPWPYNVTPQALEKAQKKFPGLIESKKVHLRRFARIATYQETKERFNVPGEFLYLPGQEVCLEIPGLGGIYKVHLNALNIPHTLPAIAKDDVRSTIAANYEHFLEVTAKQEEPAMYMLCHPYYRYYDNTPQDLIENPQIRHFEVCNDGQKLAKPCPECFTNERFWDIVNAFRLSRNQPCLYGAASDDAHIYAHRGDQLGCVVNDAWVMVRCPEMSVTNLINAMNQGDYYASCGVTLKEIEFDRDSRTLKVEVEPEAGVDYKIRFISTAKDFNQEVQWVYIPPEGARPPRVLPQYSNDIGKVVLEIHGNVAECKIQDDWLYLRAEVISNRSARLCLPNHAIWETAWTQPVF